ESLPFKSLLLGLIQRVGRDLSSREWVNSIKPESHGSMVASTEVVASSLLPFCPAEQGTGGYKSTQETIRSSSSMPPCVAGCHVAAVEAAAGDRGRDGDANRLQRAARRLLLHGGQVRRAAVPRLRAHAPGLQGRLRRHGGQAPLLRPRLRDARPSLVEDVRQGLLPQGKVKAGHEYDDATFERIFGQIYAAFGSPAPYSVFPDARPFLRWLRGEGIMAGVVTNADCRYRDVVLPALGLNQVGSRPRPPSRSRCRKPYIAQFRFWLMCAGVRVGLRGVLGRRRRREARPEDLRDGAGGGGGRGAGGGAAHRRQHEQGLRAGPGRRDARAAAGQVRDRRRREVAAVRRGGAP
uniref:Haloacid dehalogenase-like hydrolase domain-containing protein 3 n=1 Tax=Aegilops tauschii subsp. strangulata TaxID=200361 RepID=A0A453NJJ0_AEGTS